mmetsp:Transcript_18922/g.28326  ORF Transcript_18922/g.28326 Transcript_18922/m.28326 type:complete len:85 (-) Transcript_18922:140-394(-)
MPMRMAIGIAEKRKRVENKQRELDRAMGLKVSKKKRKIQKRDMGLRFSAGYEKDGIVSISRKKRDEVARSSRPVKLRHILSKRK